MLATKYAGTPYPKLTDEQKAEVRRWYGRELVSAEKTSEYYYVFDKNGKCEYAC